MMGSIVLLHGIVDVFDPSRPLVDRTLVERGAFERFLDSRPAFAAWGELPDGSGDILTIDDATRAGAEACRVARKRGHAVTFFVNPHTIISGEAYFFTMLSAAIDVTQQTMVTHRGVGYPLHLRSERLGFRRAMKEVLRRCTSEEECVQELKRIAKALEVEQINIPDHHRPITVEELRELRDLGVRIENHGWEHVEIAALTEEAFRKHLIRGREWLRLHLGVPADSYAAPFGDTFLPSLQHHVFGAWFLATRNAPAARLAERCWNRIEISDDVQRATV